MELEQYRAAQDLESRGLLRQVLPVLTLLRGRPVNDDLFSTLALALYPIVAASRDRSFNLARAVMLLLNPALPLVPVPEYQPSFLEKTLRRYLAPVSDPVKSSSAVANTAAAIVRHTEQAGREGMISMVATDHNGRWARVARGGKTCAFCLLLVSRGPVYAKDTAVFESHPACDCIAVPVRGNDWHGKSQFEAAEKLYAKATRGESDQLNAFRRAVTSGDVSSTLPAAA